MKAKELIQLLYETGEMSQDDIENGGDWYDARMELEELLKPTKKFKEVKPFDVYQGPYALMKNGDKIFMLDDDTLFVDAKSGKDYKIPTDAVTDQYKG